MSGNRVSLGFGVLCVCLVGGLIYRHMQAVRKESENRQEVQEVQSLLSQASGDLQRSQQTNSVLRSELQEATNTLAENRRQYEALSTNLAQTEERVAATNQEVQGVRAALGDREQKIKGLNADRESLSNQVAMLNRSMGELEEKLAAAESELVNSRKDREYLLQEFNRLYAEKRELEDQLRRRNEPVSRSGTRVRWSASKHKGGELLAGRFRKSAALSNYDLNVEINQTGGVKILQPPPPISEPE